MRSDEPGDARCDLVAEQRSTENAVMANAPLYVVHFPIFRNSRAQAVCCRSLSDAGNIVLLPLNGKQRDVTDVVRSDWATAMEHRAFRKRMSDKNGVDGLQVEFRGDIRRRIPDDASRIRHRHAQDA